MLIAQLQLADVVQNDRSDRIFTGERKRFMRPETHDWPEKLRTQALDQSSRHRWRANQEGIQSAVFDQFPPIYTHVNEFRPHRSVFFPYFVQ